jgi:hypothetical protein
MLAQRMCPSPQATNCTQDILGGRYYNLATKSGVVHHHQMMNAYPTDVMLL